MLTIIECPECGQRNHLDTSTIKHARCGACHERLMDDDVIPAAISDDDIAAAVEAAPGSSHTEAIDTADWVGKIGEYEQQEAYVSKGFWAKVKKYAAKVPFAKEAVSIYYCAMDPSTPAAAKVTGIGALAYWILPIDVIPDFVPVAGFVDDASAVLIAYRAISGYITSEHREKAEQFFNQE